MALRDEGLLELNGKTYMLSLKVYETVKTDVAYVQDKTVSQIQAKDRILEYLKHNFEFFQFIFPESFHIEHDQDVYKEKHRHKTDHIIREILIRSMILCHITDSNTCDLNRNDRQQP